MKIFCSYIILKKSKTAVLRLKTTLFMKKKKHFAKELNSKSLTILTTIFYKKQNIEKNLFYSKS